MKEKIFSKGNVMLFLIVFIFTLATAFVCNLCGAERITTVACAPMGGVLSLLGIGLLYEIANLKAPMGPEPGILGIVAGLIATVIFF